MNLITADSVVKDYNGHRALDHVSMEVPDGSIFGLLGPNGAGKTTLLRIVNQITAPDQGVVLFGEKAIGSEHRSQIGYLPEERGLYKKMKVIDLLVFLGQIKGVGKSAAKRKSVEWQGMQRPLREYEYSLRRPYPVPHRAELVRNPFDIRFRLFPECTQQWLEHAKSGPKPSQSNAHLMDEFRVFTIFDAIHSRGELLELSL